MGRVEITGGGEFKVLEESPFWILKSTRKIIGVVVDTETVSTQLRPSK